MEPSKRLSLCVGQEFLPLQECQISGKILSPVVVHNKSLHNLHRIKCQFNHWNHKVIIWHIYTADNAAQHANANFE